MDGLCKSLGCLGALLKIYSNGNLMSYLSYGVNQYIQELMLLYSCPTWFKDERRGKIWERSLGAFKWQKNAQRESHTHVVHP